MKNITCVNGLQCCVYCELKGFFCYTPEGADFGTCPCCGKYDFVNASVNYTKTSKYDFLYEDEFENDMRNLYKYCEFCKIIFKLGCRHCIVGCTSDVFNCHFIKRWKHKVTNIEYEGMPQFDDSNDWFENVNNVEVLEMYCPHKGDKCKNSSYPVKYNCDLIRQKI